MVHSKWSMERRYEEKRHKSGNWKMEALSRNLYDDWLFEARSWVPFMLITVHHCVNLCLLNETCNWWNLLDYWKTRPVLLWIKCRIGSNKRFSTLYIYHACFITKEICLEYCLHWHLDIHLFENSPNQIHLISDGTQMVHEEGVISSRI